MRDQPRLLQDLAGAHVPVVALWQGTHATGVASVAVDNNSGTRAVLDHLTQLGHRRIAFVGGRRLGDIKEREEAFVEYLAEFGEPLRAGYLQHGVNDPKSAISALGILLTLDEPPTAVVASTDVLAIGLLHAAHEHGLRVPEQLSITGFDDIPMAAYTVPALTTVRMPLGEMVEQALRMALDQPMGAAEHQVPVLQPSLVVRSSSGRVTSG
jgi:DNA-binding LacI/PurR family transcriptional regulator